MRVTRHGKRLPRTAGGEGRPELENPSGAEAPGPLPAGRGAVPASFRADALAPPSLQRDLDFTVDLDFKGQLCETSVSNYYKMR